MSGKCANPICHGERYTNSSAAPPLCYDGASEMASEFAYSLGQTSGVAWSQDGIEVDWGTALRLIREIQEVWREPF